MGPQPETKASELLDRIIAAQRTGSIAELVLRRFEADAKALLKSDPGSAYELLGILATHKKDEPTARAEFERALKLRSHDVSLMMNYAKAVSYFGHFRESYERARAVYEMDRLDVATLTEAVYRASAAGAYFDAKELAEALTKLGGDEDTEAEEIAQVLADAGVHEESLRAVTDAANEYVLGRGVSIEGVDWELIDGRVAVRYLVDASPEDIAHTNRDLAIELCKRFSDPLDHAIVFGCRSA